MRKCRLVFEKTGRAKYISHLDLMHTMERVFVRAGVDIVHTQGFNPHPYMVFALPLSVCTESVCELVDVQIEDDESFDEIPERLNEKSPEGIKFKKAYEPLTKFKDIAYIDAEGRFEYDGRVSENLLDKLSNFFKKDEIVIKKKTKKGIKDTDIKPGIKDIIFEKADDNTVLVKARVTAQNPTTNPDLIATALRELEPDVAPDFSEFMRMAMVFEDGKKFS